MIIIHFFNVLTTFNDVVDHGLIFDVFMLFICELVMHEIAFFCIFIFVMGYL